MLVLTRSVEEEIKIADNITVKVVEIRKRKVKLGITAPPDMPVHRAEVYDRIQEEGEQE